MGDNTATSCYPSGWAVRAEARTTQARRSAPVSQVQIGGRCPRKGRPLCWVSLVLEYHSSVCSSRRTTPSAATWVVRRPGRGLRDRRTMSVFKHGQRPSTHC
jgi:hypothetical protein